MRIKTARELGLRLREAREDVGLTQAQLARRIGTSRQWVLDLERGKSTLRLGLVLKAISALGLACDIGARASGAHDRRARVSLSDVLDRARREGPDES
ncbi:MAG: helix-turn-helix domain-containing protein [Gemmatimonadetes bacterium]|nr:helix-turn-helix domain-containing protein [Gemmatimonadota bacterium]